MFVSPTERSLNASELSAPDRVGAVRLLKRIALGFAGVALAGGGALLPWTASTEVARELSASGLLALILASSLLGLAGLSATLWVASARRDWTAPAEFQAPRRRSRFTPAERLARAARRPQGVIAPLFCAAAGLAIWWGWPRFGAVAPSATALGGMAAACAFPFLLAQRFVEATPEAALPEAPALAALLRVPALALALGGVAEIAAGQGVPGAQIVVAVVLGGIGAVACELGVRALGNWFLPPPKPEDARAAVRSLLADLLQAGSTGAGFAAPIRAQFGIDFSRSFALRFLQAAAAPVAVFLGLVAWGLTGVSLLPLDTRAVYERFGEPQAVWAPGAHFGLPWPLGRVRAVDLGVVHVTTLGRAETPDAATGAEAPAPDSANRLWDRLHPAETSFVIAAREAAGAPSFQTVDADLKVLWRVGLDDESALRAAYGAISPETLVRSETGRLMARLFAGQSLEGVIGADRERLGATLRDELQEALARSASGLEVMAVVVESIHPPLAAARAYQDVQAAEIVATTAIAVERGRAAAKSSTARQQAALMLDASRGQAAEIAATASATARTFSAERAAATQGGEAFLMERYFAALRTALARAPLLVVDDRLTGAGAPTLDLRSYGAPSTRAEDE